MQTKKDQRTADDINKEKDSLLTALSVEELQERHEFTVAGSEASGCTHRIKCGVAFDLD